MSAIQYKVKQYKNSSSAYNNFYYPRAIAVGQMTTSDLADRIQNNCSLKKSDVKACLEELAEVMNEALINSQSVKLDGIGTFSPAVKTDHMVETVSEFNVTDCVKGFKVNFLPEFTVDASGKHTTKLLVGASLTQYGQYAEGINDTKKDSTGKYVAVQLQEKTTTTTT